MLSLRYLPFAGTLLLPLAGLWLVPSAPLLGWTVVATGVALSAVGIFDFFQTKKSLLRNYPVLGRMRYILEGIRPELRQYFFETDQEEVPYSRDQRTLVYRRSKNVRSVQPFGTLRDTQRIGHEWVNHSLFPTSLDQDKFRVMVGAATCEKPYHCSVLNVSGMSYGALSPPAIEAINRGAKEGGFAQNTGEGSISASHRKHGGDLIWQIGSGYFGCRDEAGCFEPGLFAERASDDQVKMIEIKLSQGAKPGHGGLLPAEKITAEIAEARGIPMGVECKSPARHSAFETPIELMEFVEQLRDGAGGKPVGIKVCIGHPWEWFGIAKAMLETGITPDFITVDGAEGGTGAAPVEFTDHIGAPLREGLMLVRNTLHGMDLHDRVRIVASGKLVSAFDMSRAFALGADICAMARPFMFSLGCIQARACHTDCCPTGVATQAAGRYNALSVPEKYKRVANFHRNTMKSLTASTEACGLEHPTDFSPHHLMIRVNSREVRSAASQYPWLEPGDLLRGLSSDHPTFSKYWQNARPDAFGFSERNTTHARGLQEELEDRMQAVRA